MAEFDDMVKIAEGKSSEQVVDVRNTPHFLGLESEPSKSKWHSDFQHIL